MWRSRLTWLGCASLLLLVQGGALGADGDVPPPAPATAEQLAFFEAKIRPLLAHHCLQCHGPKRQRGELRLDSRDAILHGGDSGPALVPGKPDESLLLQAVRHEALVMPPTGKLTDEEVAALSRWIEIGAPWPDGQRTILAQPRTGKRISDEDRQWWSFRPIRTPGIPQVARSTRLLGPIDAFVEARLEAEGLAPSETASRAALLRRLTFDLLGLPPTEEQRDDFLADDGPDAYERLVDRLLASPRHGEQWASHWLDLVRYAESDGFKQDDYRPHAWRYRDYVVQSLNRDKPYDRFVQEQLAGDELAPGDTEALVATGYLRHWIYEYNQRDVRNQWNNILNDVTDVTADVFLAMGMGCARCHDHKYDPILQRDYFRLQAFFAPLLPRDDRTAATPEQLADYAARRADWESKTAEIRAEMAELERGIRDRTTSAAIEKFPKDIRPMLRKGATERAPFEQQLAELANRQVTLEQNGLKMDTKLKDEAKERWLALKKRLDEYDIDRPPPLPAIAAVSDVGPQAPPTYLPGGRATEPIAPGYLSVLDSGDARVPALPPGTASTGRRLALAQWLTQSDNPLTPRVAVNRLWQYHFGRGLVKTSSDFGHLGEAPTHPDLLDWLAAQLVRSDWQWKPVHRALVTSATYRQAALTPASEVARVKDPENRFLWRMSIRRLDAEQIRDAMLAATNELDRSMGGPGVEWGKPRRSVYTRVLRNQRDPLLDAFDVPDHIVSTSERNITTTPNQALLMINGAYPLERAKVLTKRLERSGATDDAVCVEQLYSWVLGRAPLANQRQAALDFLAQQMAAGQSRDDARVDLCHVLLNANEFLYVD